jgi:hypothetical protein
VEQGVVALRRLDRLIIDKDGGNIGGGTTSGVDSQVVQVIPGLLGLSIDVGGRAEPLLCPFSFQERRKRLKRMTAGQGRCLVGVLLENVAAGGGGASPLKSHRSQGGDREFGVAVG